MKRPNQFRNPILFSALVSILAGCGGGGGSNSDNGSSGGTGNSGGGGNTDDSSNVTISGTVSGISEGQVSLSNAGANKSNFADKANFNFAVPAGESYSVEVEVNPLEQLCHVENGSGDNVSQNIDNVQVICASVASAPACSGNADSDDDGLSDCAELMTFFTNPWLKDTDGDSFDDGRETADFDINNNRYVFNPRVADMATIAVDLTAAPEIDLDFTEGSGSSRSVSTTYEQSESNNISQDWGGETSRQLEVGHTLSVSNTQTVGAEVNISPTDLGGSVSYENSLTLGFEQSFSQTRGSSMNWSNSASQENSRAYGETIDLTEEQNSEYNGGFLRVTARIRNNGHIAYDLENLTLSAVLFDPTRPFDIESIGTMEFSNGGFPLTSILPGESAPLNFTTDITLGKAQQLLRDSENIVIMPGTYRLLDRDDKSLLLVDNDVSARTANIIIDYGIDAAREDKFRVSVNRGDGRRSISLRNALDQVLGLTIGEGVGSWIYGMDTDAKSTASGLLQIGNYAISTENNRYWLLAHNRNDEANSGERITDYYNLLVEAYDLDEIMLRANDNVSLVYVGDSDRDGISDRLERELGTERDQFDSDEDTLGDGLEVYGWLTNLAEAPCDSGDNLKRVYGDPLNSDSDDDGVSDADEKAECLNPSFNFISEAGEEQFVNTGAQVTLNGSNSSRDGDTASYRWTLISGPDVYDSDANAVRELSGKRPSFRAPTQVSSLVWELAITLEGETQTDTTVVQVQQDRTRAVYVGAEVSSGVEDGSRAAPFSSLSEAIQALSPGEDLYVMSQAEPYVLVNTLDIPDGTSLFGGYDENWIRDADNQRTRIQRETSLDPAAVRISSVTQPMWISGFSIFANGDNESANASPDNDVVALAIDGDSTSNVAALTIEKNTLQSSNVKSGRSDNPGSSYALQANGLSLLRIFNNTLIAGNGGWGNNGTGGTDGADGDDASGRTAGSGNGSGGDGGTGGSAGGSPFGSGGKGADGGPSSSGGDGGAGGHYVAFNCGSSGNPKVGSDGAPGAAGAEGSPALSPLYELLSSVYEPTSGKDGKNGSAGLGGGGGGGGQACDLGAGGGLGGGGGEGGAGGTLGFAGKGGGASIGLWLNDILSAEIRDNNISSTQGGVAGAGGRGGDGGDRGQYGNGGGGNSNIFGVTGRSGARGGWGGAGGRGGHGSGGTGGPSFGVFVAPFIAPLFFDNIINPGAGGTAGFSYGNAGNGGDSFAIFDADLSDGATPEVDDSNSLTEGTAGAAGSTIGGTAGESGWAGTTNF